MVQVAEWLALRTLDYKVPVRICLEAEYSMALHCAELFIITLPSSRYGLNNVQRDTEHQIIIISMWSTGTQVSDSGPLEPPFIDKCRLYSNTLFYFKPRVLVPCYRTIHHPVHCQRHLLMMCYIIFQEQKLS